MPPANVPCTQMKPLSALFTVVVATLHPPIHGGSSARGALAFRDRARAASSCRPARARCYAFDATFPRRTRALLIHDTRCPAASCRALAGPIIAPLLVPVSCSPSLPVVLGCAVHAHTPESLPHARTPCASAARDPGSTSMSRSESGHAPVDGSIECSQRGCRVVDCTAGRDNLAWGPLNSIVPAANARLFVCGDRGLPCWHFQAQNLDGLRGPICLRP